MSALIIVIMFAMVAIALAVIKDQQGIKKEELEYEVWKKSIQLRMDSYNKEMDEIFKNIDQLIEKSKNEKK